MSQMSHVSSFIFCSYNCAGLRFGKIDIGRYEEVSKKSVLGGFFAFNKWSLIIQYCSILSRILLTGINCLSEQVQG